MNLKNIIINHKMLLLICVLFIAIYSFRLTQFPHLWIDEIYWSNPAYNLAFDGTIGTSIKYGFNNIANYTYWQPPVFILLLAASFKMFGFGLEQGRMLTVFLGLITVIFTYFLAKELYNKKIGIIASLFLVSSPFFLFISRQIRMEIAVACFSIIAIYFVVLAIKNSKPHYYFISALFVALSFLSHWNGIMDIITVILIILIFKIDSVNRKLNLTFKEISYFISGLIIPLIPYLMYVSLDFNDFQGQFWSNVQVKSTILNNILSETIRYDLLSQFMKISTDGYFTVLLITFILLTLVAVYYVLKNRGFSEKILIIVLLTHIFLLASVVSLKSNYWYLGILLPFWSILLASPYSHIPNFKSWKNSFKSILAILLILGYISINFYGIYHLFNVNNDYNYMEIKNEVHKYIPQGSTLVGSGDFWMALNRDYNYYDFRGFPSKALRELNVDYILYDVEWEKNDHMNFTSQNCTPIATIPSNRNIDLSPIIIYKVNK